MVDLGYRAVYHNSYLLDNLLGRYLQIWTISRMIMILVPVIRGPENNDPKIWTLRSNTGSGPKARTKTRISYVIWTAYRTSTYGLQYYLVAAVGAYHTLVSTTSGHGVVSGER